MDNFKEFPLKAANVVLTTYSHDKLAVLGQGLMSVELDGQTATLPIEIGCKRYGSTGKALKIALTTKAAPQGAELLKDYKELLDNDLGTVNGFKAKLNAGATPTLMKARPAAYALQDGIA